MPLSAQRAFGRRIRELRLGVGMTQEDLATRCGLYRTYLSRIEVGNANPTLTMIHALAGSLRVPVTALFETSAVVVPVASPKRRAHSRGKVR